MNMNGFAYFFSAEILDEEDIGEEGRSRTLILNTFTITVASKVSDLMALYKFILLTYLLMMILFNGS